MKKSKVAVAPIAPRERPWVEKYRPKTLQDVAAQDHTINVLRKMLMSANLPHMLFYGPPGTGKTSTILALARDLFGPELSKSRVLELNASDDRGIDIVREKVKNFARVSVSQPGSKSTYPCPPYKIVILDEADSMTQDAQSALRRTMETYSRITRFCLICNYVTRIIEPLASRCSKFRFKSLDHGSTRLRLMYVAEHEGVICDEGTLDALERTSGGDMRKGITYMHSASKLVRVAAENAEDDAMDTGITAQLINEIAGVVPSDIVQDLFNACHSGQPFHMLQRKVDEITSEGYSAGQVVSQLHDYIVENESVAAKKKHEALLTIAATDSMLTDGAGKSKGRTSSI